MYTAGTYTTKVSVYRHLPTLSKVSTDRHAHTTD